MLCFVLLLFIIFFVWMVCCKNIDHSMMTFFSFFYRLEINTKKAITEQDLYDKQHRSNILRVWFNAVLDLLSQIY